MKITVAVLYDSTWLLNTKKKAGNGDVGHVCMCDVSHPDAQAMPKWFNASDWPSWLPPRNKSFGLRRNMATLNVSAWHHVAQQRLVPTAQIFALPFLMQTVRWVREPLQEATGQRGWWGGSGRCCQGAAMVGWGWTTVLHTGSFHIPSSHIAFIPLLSRPSGSEGQQSGITWSVQRNDIFYIFLQDGEFFTKISDLNP